MSGNGSCWKMNIKKRMRLWWQRPPLYRLLLLGRKLIRSLSWRIFQLGNLVVSVDLVQHPEIKNNNETTTKSIHNNNNKNDDDDAHQRSFKFFCFCFPNSPPNFLSLEWLKSECGKKKKKEVPLSMIIQQKNLCPFFMCAYRRTDRHTNPSLICITALRERERNTRGGPA